MTYPITPASPRPATQRKRDVLTRLATDEDAWVASADPAGKPYLVPLSFYWDGTTLTLATAEHTPTARNLRATGRARLALGQTRNVVLIDATVAAFSPQTVPPELAAGFAARLGWDPRQRPRPYGYFQLTPVRVQAWRNESEDAGRDLMRRGRWLV